VETLHRRQSFLAFRKASACLSLTRRDIQESWSLTDPDAELTAENWKQECCNFSEALELIKKNSLNKVFILEIEVNLQRAKTITLVWIDIIKPQVLSLSITLYWKVSLTTISLVDSSVIFLLSSNSKQELSPENKCLLVSQCPSQAEWVSTQQCWSMVVSAVNLWLSCAMHLRTINSPHRLVNGWYSFLGRCCFGIGLRCQFMIVLCYAPADQRKNCSWSISNWSPLSIYGCLVLCTCGPMKKKSCVVFEQQPLWAAFAGKSPFHESSRITETEKS